MLQLELKRAPNNTNQYTVNFYLTLIIQAVKDSLIYYAKRGISYLMSPGGAYID